MPIILGPSSPGNPAYLPSFHASYSAPAPSYSGPAPSYSAPSVQSHTASSSSSSSSTPVAYSAPSVQSTATTTATTSHSSSATTAKSTSPSSSSLYITQTPASTGYNQLPGWINSNLMNGSWGSWSNPNTGQTFYAPGVANSDAAYKGQIWVSGVGESGPISSTFNGNSVNISRPTETINEGTKTLYSGSLSTAPALSYSTTGQFQGLAKSSPTATLSQAQRPAQGSTQAPTPMMDFHAFGTNAKVTFKNEHSPEFTLSVDVGDGKMVNYSGMVTGAPLGSVLATDQAVNQAWNAYQNAYTAITSESAGSINNIKNTQNGLELAIYPNVGKTPADVKYQPISVASGLTEYYPMALESKGIITTGSWVSDKNGNGLIFKSDGYKFANTGNNTLSVDTTLPDAAIVALEGLGYSTSAAQNAVVSASGKPINIQLTKSGSIVPEYTQGNIYLINNKVVSNKAEYETAVNKPSSGTLPSILNLGLDTTSANAIVNALADLNPNSAKVVILSSASSSGNAPTSPLLNTNPVQGIEAANLAAISGNEEAANKGTYAIDTNSNFFTQLVQAGYNPTQVQSMWKALSPSQQEQFNSNTTTSFVVVGKDAKGNVMPTISNMATSTASPQYQQYARGQINQLNYLQSPGGQFITKVYPQAHNIENTLYKYAFNPYGPALSRFGQGIYNSISSTQAQQMSKGIQQILEQMPKTSTQGSPSPQSTSILTAATNPHASLSFATPYKLPLITNYIPQAINNYIQGLNSPNTQLTNEVGGRC